MLHMILAAAFIVSITFIWMGVAFFVFGVLDLFRAILIPSILFGLLLSIFYDGTHHHNNHS